MIKDLRTFESANGLPKVPVTIVRTGPASFDTSGADEWALDTQSSTGMARTVKRLYVYDAPSLSDADISVAFNKFAAQNVAHAQHSIRRVEFAASLGGSMAVDDNSMMQAAAQGQTVFASSGDTGGFCPVAGGVNGVPAGAPDVNFPASSPWAVSVGGTTLITGSDGGLYSNEIAWLAGGGGPSYFEPAPCPGPGVRAPADRNRVRDGRSSMWPRRA